MKLQHGAQAAVLATTIVGQLEHQRFTAFCGDRNPMHVDPVAARRTQAGAVVLHGVHTLLWALEELAVGHLPAFQVESLQATFVRWVYIGGEMSLFVDAASDEKLSAHVDAEGLTVFRLEMAAGELKVGTFQGRPNVAPRLMARAVTMEELQLREDDVYVPETAVALALFPHASQRYGAEAVAQMAAFSYVIGMEAPGLLSTSARYAVSLKRVDHSLPPALRYRVEAVDPRFRRVRLGIEASALSATLQAFVRQPPVAQAGMDRVQAAVARDEFADVRALVIGGSRGLGELTAKCVAAGGGRVTMTYACGAEESANVVREIDEATGARPVCLRYDVREGATAQLRDAPAPLTHVFYFATPLIDRPSGRVFSDQRFAEFSEFYVRGLYELCLALQAAQRGRPFTVFYPSTAELEEDAAGMTEYRMAKAAGEHLCRAMSAQMDGVTGWIERLPRLKTDQTVSLMPGRETDPLAVLLPILRRVLL